MSERETKIKSALGKLDPSNDGDWTGGGLPDLNRMRELTGFDDLSRGEVADALPGANRDNPGGKQASSSGDASGSSAPSSSGSAGSSDVQKSVQESAADADKAATAFDEADAKRDPALDPATNDNVGKTDLGPYETQTHTADQGEKLAEQVKVELWSEGQQPADLAAAVKDPVFLLEAAFAAMSADPRYSKNGELQNLARMYAISQAPIKAHQARLDRRYADFDARNAESAES